MKSVVSKSRSQNTRSREKKAGKAGAAPLSWRERSIVRVALGGLLCLAAILLCGLESFHRDQINLYIVLDRLGNAAFLVVGLFAVALFLKVARPGTLSRNFDIALLATISLSALLTAKCFLLFGDSFPDLAQTVNGFILPFAMAPILAAILLDSMAAVAVGIWTTAAMCIMAGSTSAPLLLSGIVVSIVSAVTSEHVRTRSRVMRAGIIAGLAQIICVFGITAVQASASAAGEVLDQATACIASGFLGAVLALLILPVFERLSGITTDITFLELTDLSHPLLQRLALEAPGTYHHSLVVANLAQAASEEIGANSLRARVCSYFHDIGKLSKPEFFSENINMQHNPHDNLPPSMSALVITAHVKEGVSLAVLHKLPAAVIDVIREHHGTTLISSFHDKAREQLELDLLRTNSNDKPKALDEWNFRYPGPTPKSRVSGVISLADPVEAASRSLEKVTPMHIEGLVDDIVSARIQDGQLDECGLTMAEINQIKKSFVFTLTSMLHGRTAYPKDEDRDKQPTAPVRHRPSPIDTPDISAHG
ncbi:MAG: HDIG domain-containing protein [Verrucomicrobia bacterium]|nr:HDIG domain-containing protein [Verrucomicrobiota bacterium]